MGPKTEKLIDIINQIIAVLEADGECHWRKLMMSSRSRLLNSDYSGVELLLRAYAGGMGSFNDLVIGQSLANGQFCWKTDARETNNRLSALRSEAYELANFIKHNHEIKKA